MYSNVDQRSPSNVTSNFMSELLKSELELELVTSFLRFLKGVVSRELNEKSVRATQVGEIWF